MSDDVTLGEIARGQEAIRTQLSRLIGRDEYTAHQQLLDQRFRELTDDVADLKQRLNVAETKRWQVWLAIFSGLLAPAILLYFQARGA